MQCPVLVVIGPSGSGKTSLVSVLQRQRVLVVTPTWTTRPRRPDEINGCVNHRFVNETTFDELESAGFFVGTARLPGLPYRYGQPHIRHTGDGRIATLVSRAMAVPLIRELCQDCVTYQIETPAGRATSAVSARSESPMETTARLAELDNERSAGRELADRVFVNDRSLADLVTAVSDAIAHDFTQEANAA